VRSSSGVRKNAGKMPALLDSALCGVEVEIVNVVPEDESGTTDYIVRTWGAPFEPQGKACRAPACFAMNIDGRCN
jgi:hypothetical protein